MRIGRLYFRIIQLNLQEIGPGACVYGLNDPKFGQLIGLECLDLLLTEKSHFLIVVKILHRFYHSNGE